MWLLLAGDNRIFLYICLKFSPESSFLPLFTPNIKPLGISPLSHVNSQSFLLLLLKLALCSQHQRVPELKEI